MDEDDGDNGQNPQDDRRVDFRQTTSPGLPPTCEVRKADPVPSVRQPAQNIFDDKGGLDMRKRVAPHFDKRLRQIVDRGVQYAFQTRDKRAFFLGAFPKSRAVIALVLLRIQIQRRDRLPVDLAVRKVRQAFDKDEAGWNHCRVKFRPQRLAQTVRLCALLLRRQRRFGHDKRQKDLVVVRIYPGGDRGVLDAPLSKKQVFDFGGLDAHTADLDLRIHAPEYLDLAVRTNTAKVACHVDQIVWILAQGVGAEDGLCQIVIREVPLGTVWRPDRDLASFPKAAKPAAVVQDDDIRTWLCVADRLHPGLDRIDAVEQFGQRGFGGAV